MINYGLQTTINIDGEEYPINKKGDYRLILDIFSAFNDPDLNETQKIIVSLNLFYDFNIPEDLKTATEKMFEFINNGEENQDSGHINLMDWEYDFNLYIAPVNKALGYEVRAVPYLHWWTFLSGYMSIDSESTFSTVINIRRKIKEGKKLDDFDKEFVKTNRSLIYTKKKLSSDNENWLMGGDD